MKKLIFVMALILTATVLNAQTKNNNVTKKGTKKDMIATNKKLVAPDSIGGTSLMEALWRRKSDREMNGKELSEKELSNLLWAATGINRINSGLRTNPTAKNTQEIQLYVFLPSCVCRYDHISHSLEKVADGDHRNLMAAGQDFVKRSSAVLLIVVDMSKFGEHREAMQFMGAADAGIVSQNINLFCAANGLLTVTRGTMEREAVKQLLRLSADQIPMLNNPVGYPVR